MFRNSRLMLESVIGDNPRADLNYLKYLTALQNTALTRGISFTQQSEISTQAFSQVPATYRGSFTNLYIGLQSTRSVRQTFGIKSGLRLAKMAPTFAPTDTLDFSHSDRSLYVEGFYRFNTLNKMYFPTSGWEIWITT